MKHWDITIDERDVGYTMRYELIDDGNPANNKVVEVSFVDMATLAAELETGLNKDAGL